MFNIFFHPRPRIVDGSILSETLFGQLRDWQEARGYDYFRISKASPHFYGLKSSPTTKWSTLDIRLDGPLLTIKQCQAVTPLGTTVNIQKGFTDLPVYTLDPQLAPGSYDVVLVAAPYSYQPWGEADPQLIPYRLHHELPAIRVELNRQNVKATALGPDGIKLAVLEILPNGKKVLSKDYIPPSLRMNAYDALLSKGRAMAGIWLHALKHSNAILGNARKKASEGNYNAQLVAEWILPIQQYLLENCYYFQHQMETGHPETLFSRCITLVNYVRHGFESSSDKRQLLMNIHSQLNNASAIGQWQDQLMETLSATVTSSYSHTEIAEIFNTLQTGMDLIITSLNAMAYDQHYNGQNAIIQTRKKSFFSL